jgi:glycosyltransferase involved in cell wall biosynthesis
MIHAANVLVAAGYQCDLYFEEDDHTGSEKMRARIVEYYGECLAQPFVGISMRRDYDLIFATYSELTPDYLSEIPCRYKGYFIQDYEPWFFPMSERSLSMENTYRYDYFKITIGKWLVNKLAADFGSPARHFSFCADTDVYKPLAKTPKEKAVCFIYQPDKARRCAGLGVRALRIVKELRPDWTICLYGNTESPAIDLTSEDWGVISVQDCNALYNRCSIGLCISSSNPSRIPFEMMAAGLPVVDIHRENNLYDLPENAALLAEASPEGIATAIVKLIDDDAARERMRQAGIGFMRDFPMAVSDRQFVELVQEILSGARWDVETYPKSYSQGALETTEEVRGVRHLVQPRPLTKQDLRDRRAAEREAERRLPFDRRVFRILKKLVARIRTGLGVRS